MGPSQFKHSDNFNRACIRNVFSKLAPHHFLCYLDVDICLSVMHSEAQADEVREDSGSPFCSADWGCAGCWRSGWEMEADL